LLELERINDKQKVIEQLFGGWGDEEIKDLKDPEQMGIYKYFIRIPQ
jgi:hypothetical protein